MLKIRGKQAFIVLSIIRGGWRSKMRDSVSNGYCSINRAEIVAFR